MLNKEIHFYDLDNTLWNIIGKVWIISKNNPNKPLLKISFLEYLNIKNKMYINDKIEIEYNDSTYWIPQSMLDRIQKRKNIDPDLLGISKRELFDPNYIKKINFNLKNILHLKDKKVDIGILTGRMNQENEQEYLNLLREKLKQLNLNLTKIYYVGEFLHNSSDKRAFEKMKVLLEHLIGVKILGDKFVPIKQDWYENVYFYDDEVQNIYSANNIQEYFENYMKNTDDETFKYIIERIKNNDLTLITNLISGNEMNMFETKKIIITEPVKYPIKVESLEIKKFKEF
jgi:hypothetical protein